MGEETFDQLGLQDAKTVTVNFHPYGWWTGHYHYMDDLKLTLPDKTIIDDFDDGVIDTSIWQAPVNPDGVREEDGILKMEQLRTDQDFQLRSNPIPLTDQPVAENGCPDGYHPHMIDLGLPSGTKWACCNVGASSPEEYGLYFAWGETQGNTSDTSDGHSFDWESYKWCNGSNDTMTKYCVDSSCGYNGFTDGLTELLPEDDAATANWGSGWRMPSDGQFEELINNEYTTTGWTTLNGVNDRKITSKVNGNTIFLPAAGFRDSAYFSSAGSDGVYWSRSLVTIYSSYAQRLDFRSGYYYTNGLTRYCGQSVRPVQAQN